MSLGGSVTAWLGGSGTRYSVDREPKSPANRHKSSAATALNYPNKESCRFLLTPPRLWTSAALRPPCTPFAALDDDPALTHVTLFWRGGGEEDWLRFGKPVSERIIDRSKRIESYAPGQVFALVRWASNAFGTRRSTLAIVRAVAKGEAYTTMPNVDPGGELLLAVRGWPKVRKVLALIDAIDAAGTDPCEVAPDHWRHMHNRVSVGMSPRAYGRARHDAWLRRSRLQS